MRGRGEASASNGLFPSLFPPTSTYPMMCVRDREMTEDQLTNWLPVRSYYVRSTHYRKTYDTLSSLQIDRITAEYARPTGLLNLRA